MDRINIGIVGCGAIGVSFLSHLVEEAIQNNLNQKISLYLFEKSADIACGLPYKFDYDCNLLNRTVDKMSIDHEKLEDFYDWIMINQVRIKNLFPNITKLDRNNFLPRSIFGLYLHDTFLKVISKAKQDNISVNIIKDEVIELIENQSIFKVRTTNNFFDMDYVVLTVGHIESKKFKVFNKYKSFYNSPYPTTQLVSTIEKGMTIGILGSRLSAIDVALALTEYGHKGKIFFLSRNKFLPSIKSINSINMDRYIKIINEILMRNINSNRSVSLKKIIKIIRNLVSRYSEEKPYFYKWLNRPIDPIEFIRYELNECEKNSRQVWDAIFLEGNNIIEWLWNKLSVEEKRWFLKNYKSKWISYRIGIPKENAMKILSLFEKGQLFLLKADSIPIYKENIRKFFLISEEKNKTYCFDYLINATGSPLFIEEMESLLINNGLRSGIFKRHEFGGIDVDFDTSRVINSNGKKYRNLYAIGSITSGVYFFTSALSLNIKHSYCISKNILSSLVSIPKYAVNC